MYKTRATWECTWQGQKRAYADTTTEGKFTVEAISDMDTDFRPFPISDEEAKKMLRAFVGFSEGTPASPFDPVLRTFEKIDEGVWYVFVTSRYTD